MTNETRIVDRESLAAVRYRHDLECVTIETAKLKFRNLLPCALKYGLWALRPGGRLIIRDTGGSDPAPSTLTVSSNLVRQWIACFIGREVEWAAIGAGQIELVRSSPVLVPGWSAGVVFSGQDSEVPMLRACLDGLLAQPELAPDGGGEIVVCGPARDLDFLSDYPSVRYLPFETPPSQRFLIGQKKNALMASLKGPRMIVLHTRVVLEAGALAGMPREFDISSPNTSVLVDGVRRPYLSLTQSDGVWLGHATRRTTVMLRQLDGADPTALLERGPVFIDGGAFCVTRAVFDACPLNPFVAWNEGEDVEWCGRAHMNGFLVDMSPRSPAYSQTNKLGAYRDFGAVTPYLRRAAWTVRSAAALVNDRVQRMRGRR